MPRIDRAPAPAAVPKIPADAAVVVPGLYAALLAFHVHEIEQLTNLAGDPVTEWAEARAGAPTLPIHHERAQRIRRGEPVAVPARALDDFYADLSRTPPPGLVTGRCSEFIRGKRRPDELSPRWLGVVEWVRLDSSDTITPLVDYRPEPAEKWAFRSLGHWSVTQQLQHRRVPRPEA
jgi:hypothetical protein